MMTYEGSLIVVSVHVLSYSKGFILLLSSIPTSSYNLSSIIFLLLYIEWTKYEKPCPSMHFISS